MRQTLVSDRRCIPRRWGRHRTQYQDRTKAQRCGGKEQRRDGTEQGAAHWTDRDLHDAEAVHGLKQLFGKAARQLSKELLFIVARLAI